MTIKECELSYFFIIFKLSFLKPEGEKTYMNAFYLPATTKSLKTNCTLLHETYMFFTYPRNKKVEDKFLSPTLTILNKF